MAMASNNPFLTKLRELHGEDFDLKDLAKQKSSTITTRQQLDLLPAIPKVAMTEQSISFIAHLLARYLRLNRRTNYPGRWDMGLTLHEYFRETYDMPQWPKRPLIHPLCPIQLCAFCGSETLRQGNDTRIFILQCSNCWTNPKNNWQYASGHLRLDSDAFLWYYWPTEVRELSCEILLRTHKQTVNLAKL